jgi:hypothetical protein
MRQLSFARAEEHRGDWAREQTNGKHQAAKNGRSPLKVFSDFRPSCKRDASF